MTEVSIIHQDELRARLERKEVTLLEALSPAAFEEGHLPGAKPLLPEQAEKRAAELIPRKDSEVVVYCATAACQNSTKLALKLMKLGYTDVKDYEAGKEDWLAAGLPVERGAAAQGA